MLRSVAPVLPVADVRRALKHYATLGFRVSAYEPDGAGDPPFYGYLDLDGVSMHLALDEHAGDGHDGGQVYLYVDDADELHRRWSAGGADGRFIAPVDATYGLREGAHVDPDGNLVRYGSWLPGHGPPVG